MSAAAIQKTNRDMLETTLSKIARILSDRYDINVFFRGDDCFTEGRNIYLPAIPEDCPEDLLHAIQGFLDHEAAHMIFTDFNAMTAIPDKFHLLWYNIVEDARVETRIKEVWRGCGENLDNVEMWSLQHSLEHWDDLNDFVRMAKAAVLFAKKRTDLIDRLPEPAKLYEAIEPITPALEMATEIPDTAHAIALSEWICKKLGHKPEKPITLTEEERERLEEAMASLREEFKEMMEATAEEGAKEEEGAEGEAEGEKSEEEPEESEEPEEGEEEKGEEEEKSMEEQFEELEYDPFLEPQSQEEFDVDPEEITKAMEETGGAGGSISSAVGHYRHYETETTTDTYIPYDTSRDVIQTADSGDKAQFSDEIREMKKSSGVLVRRLKAALLTRYRAQMEYDQTWGKLNTRALPRLLISGYPKVFKRKVVSESLSARFSLLIDQSGSMRGRKSQEARRAAILFGEFADKMGIPFEILGFTSVSFEEESKTFSDASEEDQRRYTRWGQLEINIYKHFHEDWRKVGHRLMNLQGRCHNYDGESVLLAAKRLLAAKSNPNERSVLFVFSDGLPEQHIYQFQPHHQRYLKRVAEQVQQNGVECFGIGIMTDSVSRYYNNWTTIDNPAQLQGAQIEKLKEALQLNKSRRKKRI
jgi:cobalamin biosynthesis protein CobT